MIHSFIQEKFFHFSTFNNLLFNPIMQSLIYLYQLFESRLRSGRRYLFSQSLSVYQLFRHVFYKIFKQKNSIKKFTSILKNIFENCKNFLDEIRSCTMLVMRVDWGNLRYLKKKNDIRQN